MLLLNEYNLLSEADKATLISRLKEAVDNNNLVHIGLFKEGDDLKLSHISISDADRYERYIRNEGKMEYHDPNLIVKNLGIKFEQEEDNETIDLSDVIYNLSVA